LSEKKIHLTKVFFGQAKKIRKFMIFEFEATPDFFLCFNLIVRIFYQSQDLSWKTQKKMCVARQFKKERARSKWVETVQTTAQYLAAVWGWFSLRLPAGCAYQ
jgi:hypothetical protein